MINLNVSNSFGWKNSTNSGDLGLLNVRDYSYLNQSGCIDVEGIDDATEFDTVVSSMNELGWEPEEMQSVLRIVAAVLTLGNIKFNQMGEGSSVANIDGKYLSFTYSIF